MSEINFNSIYDGVSRALHDAYPDRQIHGGTVKQGLKPGDFNVIMPSADHFQEVGPRFRRGVVVDVIYYPRGGNAECFDMAHELTLTLRSITTPQGDIIHASSCEWQVTEDVLHVLLQYDHFGFHRTDDGSELMGTLTIKQEGKAYG